MIHQPKMAGMAYNLLDTEHNHSADTDLMDNDTVIQNMELYHPDSDSHPRDPSEYNH